MNFDQGIIILETQDIAVSRMVRFEFSKNLHVLNYLTKTYDNCKFYVMLSPWEHVGDNVIEAKSTGVLFALTKALGVNITNNELVFKIIIPVINSIIKKHNCTELYLHSISSEAPVTNLTAGTVTQPFSFRGHIPL